MAKVIRVHELGGPEQLRVDDVDLAPPRPFEARVRQTAVGVNFIDVYHRTGVYPLAELPHGIGMEGAGVVEAVGDGVTEVSVGQRVAYAAPPPGSYASSRNVTAERLVPIPDDVDDETAAAMMLKGMTVEYLIRRTFPVKEGMTVLFHAAAGGVGLIACQWLRHLGVTVIGTVGSDEKAEIARSHGCHHPVVYTREDVVARVRELTGGDGVPVVFDSVGRDTFSQSLDCLAPRGMMVSFGNASGTPPEFDPMTLSARGSLFLTRPVLFDYVATRDDLLRSAAALFDVVAAGAVQIDIGHRFGLDEAHAAHEALEGRRTTGSTVLIP